MTEAILLGIFLFIACGGVLFIQYMQRKMHHRMLDQASIPWCIEEHPGGNGSDFILYLVRGNERQKFDSVPWNHVDFEGEIEVVRNRAEMRKESLNAPLKRRALERG